MSPALVHAMMSPVPDVDVVMAVAATEAVFNARAAMMVMAMPVTMADGLGFMSGLTVAMVVTFTRCGRGGRQARGQRQGGSCENGENGAGGEEFHVRLGVGFGLEHSSRSNSSCPALNL